MWKNNPVAVFFLFLIIAVLLYFNAFAVGFIWDDFSLVVNNPLIKSFTNILRIFSSNLSVQGDIFYRPIQNLTLMLDFFLYKLDFRGYHLTNIFLHVLVAFLFYRLSLAISGSGKISLLSCLLFLVNPLWVESVTYISGRADLLLAIFIILSLLFFISERLILSLACFVLALFSKEAALVFPLILLAYLTIMRSGSRRQKAFCGLLFLVVFIYAAIRLLFRHAGISSSLANGFSLQERGLFFIQAISEYIILIFLPIKLHMSYTVSIPATFFDPKVLLSFLCLLMLFSLGLYYYLKKEKTIAFYLAWFFIWLLPYSGIFPINAFFAEHFIYLASFGILSVFGYYLAKMKARTLSYAIFSLYLVFYSLGTVEYNFAWQDPIKFYQRIIKYSHNSFGAYSNLGILYLNMGNLEEARKMITRAIEIDPDFPEAQLNLARYYYLKNDYQRAIGLAKNVAQKHPVNFSAWNFLGTFYLKAGEIALAQECFNKAVQINGADVSLWLDLYSFYASVGKKEKLEEIKSVISGMDEYAVAEIYANDASEFLKKSLPQAALEAVNQAIKVNPYNGAYQNLKGHILNKLGDYPAALLAYQESIKASPFNPEAYNNLGNLFALSGNLTEAENYFKRSVKLNPYFAEGYFNLGLLYFEQKSFPLAKEFFEKALSISGYHPLAKEYLDKINASADKR